MGTLIARNVFPAPRSDLPRAVSAQLYAALIRPLLGVGQRTDAWQTRCFDWERMDDLDREIEEAARLARRRVWQGRLATIASTAALLVIGIGGTIAVYQLFPERDEREFDAVRRENAARFGEDPGAAAIAESMATELAADRRDRSGLRWRLMPGFALGFGAAYLIRKHLQPK